MAMAEEGDEKWRREKIHAVLKLVSTCLPQRDLLSLLLVSSSLYHYLVSYRTYPSLSLWQVLDLREMTNVGNRLLSALSLPRYADVKSINLEFAQDIDDMHLELVGEKSLQKMECLNLNGCQKISDKGVESITRACPNLKVFSIYWNVRVTDAGILQLVKHCKHIVDLNLSGCKNITDKSLQLIADKYQYLEVLNITRCVKVTDSGLQQVLHKSSSLRSLNLYALSSLSDQAYTKIALLANLEFLDLCGAQNLTDKGLKCIANCKTLVSLNLTWCVQITDVGIIALAQSCTSLEFLSLFGIVGVTDESLEALSRSCSRTLKTLDVNGCINIKRRSHGELLQMFPRLECFKVHS